MKYFLIAGEASGDLHASRLMQELRVQDEKAEFRFYGGDLMSRVGGVRLKHYREMAYMGIVPVVLHLPTILRTMRDCKRAIAKWQPDVVILIDYPGFNLSIARYVHSRRLCPVHYYISPKIWAWKEGRIRRIKRDVDRLFSILPFEVDFFERKHGYPITYVGNPTLDEVAEYTLRRGRPVPDGRTIALLPGSRRQEIKDNLQRMLQAVGPFCEGEGYTAAIALAPAVPRAFYEQIVRRSGLSTRRIQMVENQTFELLSRSTAALVTSGTATLETALFRVPQVVCYYIACGPLVRLLRRLLLKVRYISLVNLIANEEVVPELVADAMNPRTVAWQLKQILPSGERREAMLQGYDRMVSLMGEPGAPRRAARAIVADLRKQR